MKEYIKFEIIQHENIVLIGGTIDDIVKNEYVEHLGYSEKIFESSIVNVVLENHMSTTQNTNGRSGFSTFGTIFINVYDTCRYKQVEQFNTEVEATNFINHMIKVEKVLNAYFNIVFNKDFIVEVPELTLRIDENLIIHKFGFELPADSEYNLMSVYTIGTYHFSNIVAGNSLYAKINNSKNSIRMHCTDILEDILYAYSSHYTDINDSIQLIKNITYIYTLLVKEKM